MNNNNFYKSLATLTTFGIVVIAAALIPIAIESILYSREITHVPKRVKVPSRAWLIIKYGTRIGDLLLDIPMESIEQCEEQGALLLAAKEINRSSKSSFVCLKSE